MLAEDEDDPLVAVVLQGLDLGPQVGLRERAMDLLGIGTAEAAILAIVGAFVAHVQRRKEHDAVAVDVALQLPGGGEDLLDAHRVVGGQQHGRLLDARALLGHALGDHVPQLIRRGRLPQQAEQPRLVDKVLPALAQLRPVDRGRHRRTLQEDRELAAAIAG